MKHLLEVCLVALTLTAGIPRARATQSLAAASDNAAFGGTWEGKMNNLPGIHLKIQGAERKISGDIVFYFQKRNDPSGPWHVAGESAAPLLVPHVEGKTLTFEVQHHRCHECPELGPNVRFRMVLADANQARLWNLNEGLDSGPGMILVRQTEASGSSAPAMPKGISVELPVTSHAAPVPKADEEGSLIVTITDDGSLYFGVTPIGAAELAEKVKSVLSNRAEKTLYIKADARTPYAGLVEVLDSVRTTGVEGLTLLTVQRGAEQPGTRVLPKGLELLVVSPHSLAHGSSRTERR